MIIEHCQRKMIAEHIRGMANLIDAGVINVPFSMEWDGPGHITYKIKPELSLEYINVEFNSFPYGGDKDK